MITSSCDPAELRAPAFRRAAIDVGTNSVKLLVADVSGRVVTALLERNKQTRLGRGFYRDHRLQPGAIEQTARVVGEFADEARRLGASDLRIIATSAAREAENQEDLLAAVRGRTGCDLEIISGEREADWIYRGVATDEALAGQPILIVDVGGGSTEFILGGNSSADFQRSYRLGTVRLLEKFPPSDPPTDDERGACREWVGEFMTREVLPELPASIEVSRRGGLRLIGTGGTATVLACMAANVDRFDARIIEATSLSLETQRELVVRLWRLPHLERRKLAGLPPDRADVILTGSLIYLAVLEQLAFAELRVSTRGLRYAAVL